MTDVQNQLKYEKLVKKIVHDLLLEGGICNAELLVAFNPSIRRHLGDRKLLSFLRGIFFFIDVFAVNRC